MTALAALSGVVERRPAPPSPPLVTVETIEVPGQPPVTTVAPTPVPQPTVDVVGPGTAPPTTPEERFRGDLEPLQRFLGEPINGRTLNGINQIVTSAVYKFNESTGNTIIEVTTQCGDLTTVHAYEMHAAVFSATATTASTTNIFMNNLWPTWNIQYTTCGHQTACTCGTTSMGWTQATYTNHVIQSFTWNAWNETHAAIIDAGGRQALIRKYSRRQMTDEELRAELEREKKAREEAEKRAREAQMAQARAEALLLSCLSAQQREDLQKKSCFYVEVEGKDGKKERYRIDRGSHGNVKQIDERGSIIRSFCIQPSDVPNGDVLLSQKLFLESSDATRNEFWETANITTLMKEKEVPHTIPRRERRNYAEAHGLLH